MGVQGFADSVSGMVGSRLTHITFSPKRTQDAIQIGLINKIGPTALLLILVGKHNERFDYALSTNIAALVLTK